MFDAAGTPYLDFQMWYSAVNFGYKNPRLTAVMKKQLDDPPQVASQYLHPTKIGSAKSIAQDAEHKFAYSGRVDFNVGSSGCRCARTPTRTGFNQILSKLIENALRYAASGERLVIAEHRRLGAGPGA
jgi:signal transduction histidine kinase